MPSNFSLSEFACACGCPENHTKLGLLTALQEVRDIFGRGIKIASGYRCEFHNKGVGGSPKSSHILGLAADIVIPDSVYAFQLMKAIFDSGRFQRVGYGKMSGTLVLHVDVDLDKPQEVLWGY
mgnify:FL=1